MNNLLTSIEIKQLLRGEITNRDVASLFITWAIKGYIYIEEHENRIIITKLKNIYEERDFETWLFLKLFKKQNSLTLNDLYGGMYSEFQTIMIASKRHLNKLDSQLRYKIIYSIIYFLIGITYYNFIYQLTSTHLISIIGGFLYLIPHLFAGYVIQTAFHQEVHIGNAIWAGIIYFSFIGVVFGLRSLGQLSIVFTLFSIVITLLLTIALGYLKYKKNSAHNNYKDARKVEEEIKNKKNISELSFVTVLLLGQKNLFKKEKVTFSQNWNNFTETDFELLEKVDKLITQWGKELAPTPLPSGTIAASK